MDSFSFGDVFLQTSILNKHLTSIMDGLTAKVFRTYNASRTLQEQLDKLTDPNDTPAGLVSRSNVVAELLKGSLSTHANDILSVK